MIYLACPYSHDDPKVREYRANVATEMAAQYIGRGMMTYSPLTYGHPINKILNREGTWSQWQKHDIHMLKHCDEVVVLILDGWKESKGLDAELHVARALGLPITYVDPGVYGCL